MKKLFIILVFFQVFTFINGNEKVIGDNDYTEITREFEGYFKGNKFLRTKDDFIEALSPVPEAKELYLISIIWKYSAVSLLCTSIASEAAALVLAYISIFYGDEELRPQYYNFLLSNICSYTGLSLLILFIPQFVLWIVSFGQYAKKKKEAVRIYNKRVNKINEKKSGIELNGSPYVIIDDKKNFYAGLVFSLRFN